MTTNAPTATTANAGPTAPVEEVVDGKQLWNASNELSKARALRNYFQLERDKINAFWEISKCELESVRAELRNKEREKAEMVERHQVELKVYKQKMRHVLYEQQVHIVQMKTEAERALKNKQEEHREKENDLRRDRRDLVLIRREQELEQRDLRNAMKEQQDRELTEMLRLYELQMKELHLKYQKKISNLRDDMEARRQEDIQTIENRKREQEEQLIAQHDKAFSLMQDYYREILTNNIEKIKGLKKDVSEKKMKEARNEKDMYKVAKENKTKAEPLMRLTTQKTELATALTSSKTDRTALMTSKQELRQLEQRLKTLMWEHEVLGLRFEKLQEDRDIIFSKYNNTMQEIQRKMVFKRVLLHRKLDVVSSQLERKDAQLAELLKNANVDVGTAQTVERKLEDIVSAKNKTVEELQHLLSVVTDRHEKVVGAFDTYLRQNGVPGLTLTQVPTLN